MGEDTQGTSVRRLLSIREAAVRLSRSPKRVRKLIRKHTIRGVWNGGRWTVPESEVLRLTEPTRIRTAEEIWNGYGEAGSLLPCPVWNGETLEDGTVEWTRVRGSWIKSANTMRRIQERKVELSTG